MSNRYESSNKFEKVVVGIAVGILLILLAPWLSFRLNLMFLSMAGSMDSSEYALSIPLYAASFRLIGFLIVACTFTYYLVYGRKEIKKEEKEFEEEMQRAEAKKGSGKGLMRDEEGNVE